MRCCWRPRTVGSRGHRAPTSAPGSNNGFDDFVLYDIFFLDESHGWITGNNDQSFRTIDGGVT